MSRTLSRTQTVSGLKSSNYFAAPSSLSSVSASADNSSDPKKDDCDSSSANCDENQVKIPSAGGGISMGAFDTKTTDKVFGLMAMVPMPKPLKMKECKISQTLFTPTWDSSGSAHGNSWSLLISTLPQFSALSSLFDIARIDRITWVLTPGVSPGFGLGKYFVAVDWDDATTPGSLTTVENYQNVITVPGQCGVTRTFVPAVASSIYSGYASGQKCWINLDYSGIQLYGVKVWFTAGGGTVAYDLTVQVDMTLKVVR